MLSSLDAPKVFISYSWKPTINKQKTITLAERMVNDGVNIILDEWNLTEGEDKYQFMEQMVNDPEIKRVLIICNRDYKEKADQKKGGVGTESLIISDKIYKQADQKKFIPVIFEKDEKNEPYVPTFIHSRIYIDLSSDEVFEDEYEKLLRNIFDKPASKKPPIGTPPAYLLEDKPTFLKTAHKVKAIQNALTNEKKNFQVFIDDYYDTFIDSLNDFEITKEELVQIIHIDETILQRIEALKALRDDFIGFLSVLLTYSSDFNFDKFFSFIEKLIGIIMKHNTQNHPNDRYGNLRVDHFRFFFYELFLYTTAVMLEREKYNELGKLLNQPYIIYNEQNYKTESYSFTVFQNPVDSLDDYRKKRLNLRRVSVVADLIKQRADRPKYTFEKIQEGEALLYYVSIMMNKEANQYFWLRWFPLTSAYRIQIIPFLERLISLRFFEKVKVIFEIKTVDELKQKIQNTTAINADQFQRIDYRLPYLQQAFNFEKIGTLK